MTEKTLFIPGCSGYPLRIQYSWRSFPSIFNLVRDEDGKLTMEELRQASKLFEISNLTYLDLNHHCQLKSATSPIWTSVIITSQNQQPDQFQPQSSLPIKISNFANSILKKQISITGDDKYGRGAGF